ncbi:MAG: lipocalin family protein [Halieaceae bacterium]|jgi:apolipoprotein D and lipocalin family protein|nr:lipocalin family protein [Halieaceae bacterium]
MRIAPSTSRHKNRRSRHRLLCAWLLLALAGLASCTGIPDGVQPVQGFDSERYLGRWYEIARLDHSFERGLSQVTAQYAPGPGDSLRVLNRGYSAADGWQSAEGKALFVGPADQGHLKVSFFGPFYGSYIVFELDPDYQYAFVSGNSKSYLWLLARTPTISPELRARFIQRAKELGFPVGQLIFVEQDASGEAKAK